MWNHITCDYECNETCKVDEYLDVHVKSIGLTS